MSDQDALLRAIITKPLDDAPRLVYADWLDEHGDPDRAEFIRLTVGLRTTPDDHASRRARELLSRNGNQWRQEAPALPDVLWGDDLSRGFVHEAYLPSWASFVSVRDKIFRAVPLDNLAIGRMTTPDCRQLADEKRLRRLRTLVLSGGFDDIGVQVLAACPYLENLECLYLGGLSDGISDPSGTLLVKSPFLSNLRRLHAAGYQFSNKTKAALLARFPEANV